ncbi:DNA mismatch repair endonuclease MutH [Permianibacter aggregans]|nr:DNA mismatch repair endonuclease MutH [Permianibacter aggregans]
MRVQTPQSAEELLMRARALAGLSLADIAEQFELSVPRNLRREKGWQGQLIERALGASSGSLAQADFPDIGVELKTLPIDQHGLPTESTWVCIANLMPTHAERWQDSLVYEKLKRVLWLPVQDDDNIPLAERRIGSALLWQPDAQQMQRLEQDFLELTERIALGEVESISAHHGQALQLRPKAANRKVLTDARGPDGTIIKTLPRGFYLRRSFTISVIQQHLL